MSDFISATSIAQIETGSAPLLTTDAQVNLIVNRVSEVIEVAAPCSVEVFSKVQTITVSASGPVGATGPQGPAGPAGSHARFADLEDVLLVNLSNDNIIKWNSALQAFVNQESVDGGSF